MIQQDKEERFFRIVFRDFRTFLSELFSGEFLKKFTADFQDMRDYFLDEKREKQLEQMSRFRRFFYLIGWLFKNLFLRLSSFRRIMLMLAILLLLAGRTGGDQGGGKVIIGTLMLFFIILLELKDKLLAREELEAGRSVQEALAPEQSPAIPGWDVWLYTKPANDVGGDLVDYMRINGNRYGFAIGDVAGKGLPAALLMAKLQATLRAIIPDFLHLAELAEKLNRIFYRDSLPSRFASLVYMEVKADSNQLRFVNAGHLPPILLSKDSLTEMKKGATAIGIMQEVSYKEEKISITPGDMFVVYSDGVTESRNKQGDFFGDEAFKTLLRKLYGYSAKRAGEKIIETIDLFSGDGRPNDDLSIVIISRKENV